MSLTSTRPERRVMDVAPEELAARLRHLDGFLWFDTAGNVPEQESGSAFSVLAAQPRRVIRGHLSDPAPLREALAECAPPAVDYGIPTSGLFGWIDYDGAYCFGDYRDVLVYRHATGEWLESGDLLSHADAHACVPAPCNPGLAWQPGCTLETYCGMVERAREYIAAGDIYQVNLAHRFTAPWPVAADAFALALHLRDLSPAPRALYGTLGGRTVISSSPESFLRLSGSLIQTRPIKGTRPRSRDPLADERSRLDLLASEKERAELIMITDLLRNDLGRVCEYGSVTVTDLLQLERYAQVFHLVSTVHGTLRGNVDHIAAVQACFPGGSITGAPKKRAMEIIRELEPAPRGLYTGACGWFGANGESQFSIAIRTLAIESGTASFHVGAGIVTDSVPEKEWEETLHKAAGILAATER